MATLADELEWAEEPMPETLTTPAGWPAADGDDPWRSTLIRLKDSPAGEIFAGRMGAHRGRRHPQRLRPTHVLGRLGMEIVYAENGREGLEALEREKDIALVPMDVMMPEMDGYETLTAVRQTPAFAGLPIIALTAKAMPGDREKTIACGASDYVPKPVDVDRLLEVMRGRLAGERETGG